MDEASRPADFERSDADPRLLGALAAGVVVFLIAAPLLVLALYRDAPHVGQIPENLPQPPPPRLQIAPRTDLDRLRAEESRRLDSFGWTDHERKNVHIPIEHAMKLLAAKGIAGWPSAAGSPAAKPPP